MNAAHDDAFKHVMRALKALYLPTGHVARPIATGDLQVRWFEQFIPPVLLEKSAITIMCCFPSGV